MDDVELRLAKCRIGVGTAVPEVDKRKLRFTGGGGGLSVGFLSKVSSALH